MEISVIIVNYNVYKCLINCIKSIKESIGTISHEIIVVDNDSIEKDIDNLAFDFPDVKLYKMNRNLGFGAANNYAMKMAKGDYFLLVNPDLVVNNDCVSKLLRFIKKNTDVGIVAPLLYKPNGDIDYYNSFFPTVYSILMLQFGFYNAARGMKKRTFEFFDYNIGKDKPIRVEQVMGACILIRKLIYDLLGGFDEAYFLYQEETDLEYRISNEGWKILILPEAVAVHDHHSSTNNLGEIFIRFHWLRSIIIFYSKHFGFYKKIFLKTTMFITLVFREMKYCMKYFFKTSLLLEASIFTFKLIVLNFTPKKQLLRNRFIFDKSKVIL